MRPELRGMFGTAFAVLSDPLGFFGDMQPGEGIGHAVAFLLTMLILSSVVQSLIVAAFLFVGVIMMAGLFVLMSGFVTGFMFTIAAMLYPLTRVRPVDLVVQWEQMLHQRPTGLIPLLAKILGASFVFLLVASATLVLLYAVVAHVVAVAAGGTGSFTATFQVFAYCSAMVLLLFIPGLNGLLWLYGLLLVHLGLRRVHSLSHPVALVVSLLTAALVAGAVATTVRALPQPTDAQRLQIQAQASASALPAGSHAHAP